MIALLLLKWLKHLAHASWSLSNLAAMLRLNLVTYRDLLTGLQAPFGPPADADPGPTVEQLAFSLPGLGQPQRA